MVQRAALGAFALATLVSLLALGAAGCGTSRNDQLEAVARDWCMTIRASQIIPVYPLTEDIQPGDVFLVQTTADKQQDIYKKRGFLPLDNHVARLDPTGYPRFYDHSFLTRPVSAPILPWEWIRATGGHWTPAPNAAFPSYAFSVKRGAGLNLAVPISGVPVGLSLLGSQTANGSIAIERARTMGLDTLSVYGDLQAWALTHRDLLSAFGPMGKKNEPINYLRVVTRIYSTGKIDIALSDAGSVAGGADGGVLRPVEMIGVRAPADRADVPATAIENYGRDLKALNAILAELWSGEASSPPEAPAEGAGAGATRALAGVAPIGASLRVTAASSRFITLRQEFDPPLIVGYLAFDVGIERGGRLGPPIPTHARIDPDSQGEPLGSGDILYALFAEGLDTEEYDVLVQARDVGDAHAKQHVARLDALAAGLPPQFLKLRTSADGSLAEAQHNYNAGSYLSFRAHRGNLRRNIDELSRRLDAGAEFTHPSRGDIRPGSPEWKQFESDVRRWQDELDNADTRAAHTAAATAAAEHYVVLVARKFRRPTS